MSIDATRWAWQQTLKPTQKLVLLSLADRADEKSTCYPSTSRLEFDTGLNRKTIFKVVSELEKIGVLEVKRGLGKGNYYQLIGVQNRHETSTKKGTGKNKETSTENGTASRVKTSPKSGTSTRNGTSPKNGTDQSQKRDSNQSQKRYIEPINEPTNNHKEIKGETTAIEKPKVKRFKKPTLEEITRYIFEKKYVVDPDSFFNHYESNGWRVGKNPMKNWQAAIRTWHTKDKRGDYGNNTTRSTPGQNREITEADWWSTDF